MNIVPKRKCDMIPDCNDYKHINMTEKEQNEIPDGVYVSHMCTAHNERVYHRTTHMNHSSYLYPCNSCWGAKGY